MASEALAEEVSELPASHHKRAAANRMHGWTHLFHPTTPPASSLCGAGAAGCDASPTVTTVVDSCSIERHTYSNCPAGVEAHAIRYAGVGHTLSAWDTRMQVRTLHALRRDDMSFMLASQAIGAQLPQALAISWNAAFV